MTLQPVSAELPRLTPPAQASKPASIAEEQAGSMGGNALAVLAGQRFMAPVAFNRSKERDARPPAGLEAPELDGCYCGHGAFCHTRIWASDSDELLVCGWCCWCYPFERWRKWERIDEWTYVALLTPDGAQRSDPDEYAITFKRVRRKIALINTLSEFRVGQTRY